MGSFVDLPALRKKLTKIRCAKHLYSPVPQLPPNAENDDDNICSSPLNIGEKCRQQSIMPLIAPKMLAYAPVVQPPKNAENNASIIRSGLLISYRGKLDLGFATTGFAFANYERIYSSINFVSRYQSVSLATILVLKFSCCALSYTSITVHGKTFHSCLLLSCMDIKQALCRLTR